MLVKRFHRSLCHHVQPGRDRRWFSPHWRNRNRWQGSQRRPGNRPEGQGYLEVVVIISQPICLRYISHQALTVHNFYSTFEQMKLSCIHSPDNKKASPNRLGYDCSVGISTALAHKPNLIWFNQAAMVRLDQIWIQGFFRVQATRLLHPNWWYGRRGFLSSSSRSVDRWYLDDSVLTRK